MSVTNYEKTSQIAQFQAYQKFVEISNNISVDYDDAIIAKDFRRKWGALRVIAKILLGKYKK